MQIVKIYDFDINNFSFKSSALRRPSDFRRASVLISRQDLPARRNRDDDLTGSAFSLPDEDSKSRKQKSSLKDVSKKPSTADSRLSRSVSSKEMKRHQPMMEQSKRDILDYLDGLIECVEWSALFSHMTKTNKYTISIFYYFSFLFLRI